MLHCSNTIDQSKAIDSSRSTTTQRKVRTIATLAYAWILLVPCALFAQATTIGISGLVTKSTFLSPADATQEIGVALCLPLSDPHGAAEFARRVSTPGDALFHQYITPEEFAARYGANAADYAGLKEWATSNGLKVSQESIARTVLSVRGTVGQFQTIFRTQINNYRGPDGSEFYSASFNPTIPSAIASKVSGVLGLTSSKQYAPLVKVGQRLGESPEFGTADANKTNGSHGTGPGGSYDASNLRTAYSIPTFGKLQKNTVVALFEQGGFYVTDVAKYLDANKLPLPKITPVSVNHSPTTVVTSQPVIELEAVLDIDMVVGINPDVSEVLVYEDSIDTFQTALLDAMTQVADNDKAQILSISYGQDEGYQGTSAMVAENTALEQLTAEGITVLASSGDRGAYGDGFSYPYNVADPGSQPYVTGVGGTTLFTGPGSLYEGEQVWNELAFNEGATGGGISSYWPIPPYQSGEPISGYVTSHGGSSTFRNVPDVAAVGDPFTGVGIYSKPNGGWVNVGGTSVSSPIWAGYLSVLNAAFKYAGLGQIGYFNPLLYAVGSPFNGGSGGFAANYLYDIREGSNGNAGLAQGNPGYTAGYGYSNCTGNGSLWGGQFVPQLMILGFQPGTAPGPVNNVNATAAATTADVTWSASTGATAYVVSLSNLSVGTTYYPTNSFITKKTSMKLTSLTPSTNDYVVTVWAINPSGFAQGSLTFATKK